MNYKKLFGYGAVVWATAYIVATALMVYGVFDNVIAKSILVLIVAGAAYLAGRGLSLDSAVSILKYSAVWLIMAVILDAIITVPFTGWGLFTQWNIWAGYAVILLVPLAGSSKGDTPQSSTPSAPPPIQPAV